MLLGIDVGTSGLRVLAVDEAGGVVASADQSYLTSSPRPLWSEQDPQDWWTAAVGALRAVLARVPANQVRAISLTGQMHGLVLLDAHDRVLRPAILWNDQRTAAQCERLTESIGKERIVAETLNPLLTGFTAGKIEWVREHEPAVFARAASMLLPKDFVRLRLTGDRAIDMSDASGTALLNVKRRTWSKVMLDGLGLSERWLPRLVESVELTGVISPSAAEATGLLAGTPVVGGAGDQAAGGIGSGAVEEGVVSVSLGTSGVVFASLAQPRVDSALRTHTFCHAAPGQWHVMGVMLSAAGSLRWFRDVIVEASGASDSAGLSYATMDAWASSAPPGAEGLLFLPYLTGERTPHADPLARGAFVGLTTRHGIAHLARAVMEGVAFGLRDAMAILDGMGVRRREVRLTGGGARSAVWRQILADVFHAPVATLAVDEGPAVGAALLAGVGVGVFTSAPDACRRAVHVSGVTSPDPRTRTRYDEVYDLYQQLYPSLRAVCHQSSQLVSGGLSN